MSQSQTPQKRSHSTLSTPQITTTPTTPPPPPELYYNPDLFEEEDIEELLIIDIYDKSLLQRSDALNGLAIMNFDTSDPTIIIDGEKYPSKRQNDVLNNYVYTIDVEKDRGNAEMGVMGAEFDNDVVVEVGTIQHHLVIGDPFVNIYLPKTSSGTPKSPASTKQAKEDSTSAEHTSNSIGASKDTPTGIFSTDNSTIYTSKNDSTTKKKSTPKKSISKKSAPTTTTVTTQPLSSATLRRRGSRINTKSSNVEHDEDD